MFKKKVILNSTIYEITEFILQGLEVSVRFLKALFSLLKFATTSFPFFKQDDREKRNLREKIMLNNLYSFTIVAYNRLATEEETNFILIPELLHVFRINLILKIQLLIQLKQMSQNKWNNGFFFYWEIYYKKCVY